MKIHIKNKIKLTIIILLNALISLSQDNESGFEFIVPYVNFIAEAGTGIDTKLIVEYQTNYNNIVNLTASTPDGIVAFIQPNSVNKTDTVILSIFVVSDDLTGEAQEISLQAFSDNTSIQKTINLNVLPGNSYLDNSLANQYRDTALIYLISQHPEILDEYGDLSLLPWQGFYPFPPFDIVSHYVDLYENWRINVQWHVMVPPYDWKKVYIYNYEENVGWGIQINTDNDMEEIPFEQNYYFFQDTNIVNISDPNSEKEKPLLFPNPFKEKITIKLPDSISQTFYLYIYNFNGELATICYSLGSEEINLSGKILKPGLYFYCITIEKDIFTGEIVKY